MKFLVKSKTEKSDTGTIKSCQLSLTVKSDTDLKLLAESLQPFLFMAPNETSSSFIHSFEVSLIIRKH